MRRNFLCLLVVMSLTMIGGAQALAGIPVRMPLPPSVVSLAATDAPGSPLPVPLPPSALSLAPTDNPGSPLPVPLPPSAVSQH